MELAIISAMAENRVIGKDNKLPWHLPDEWAYFKRVTDGKPFLMGRKSYTSEDGLYSSVRNVVLSTSESLELRPHTEQARSLEEALDILQNEDLVFVLGGVGLYESLLPQARWLYLTVVHASFEGDVYFPAIEWDRWQLVEEIYHPVDHEHAYAFTMQRFRAI